MKLIYYPPAILLSRLTTRFLQRKFGKLKKEKQKISINEAMFEKLLSRINKRMVSPKRNGLVDFVKTVIAMYFIHPNDTVIDVGAHVGRYSLLYSFLVGEKGKVYSYEAHPTIFQSLENSIQNIPQIMARNLAVSNQSNALISMKIYPDEIVHECATVEPALMDEERMPGNTCLIEVPTQQLDDLVSNHSIQECSLIKVDVEGHEHAVIDGASNLLKQYKPIVIFEYGYIPKKFEPNTIEQIESLDYSVYDCKTLQRVHPKYVALDVTDLVAVPKTKTREFEELALFLQ